MAEERKPAGSKSTVVKKLKATAAASAYQKQWFFAMKEKVEREGGEFAILNADVPMEIFRAMDIPFVVNQWWAAICSAKRMGRKYAGLMLENGYRPDLNSYDSQALAESFDPDDHKVDADGNPMGPWGGLPPVTIAITRLTGDAQNKIFGLLAENHGAALYTMENTVARKTPLNWYELAPDRWEDLYDKDRLDMAVEELKELIRFLETKTGRMFDINRLEHVLNLVNEQEGYYKKTRDLIARTHPVPVTVVDTINAVMQAQWQRGTEWATAHAKSLYEEIKALVDGGYQTAMRILTEQRGKLEFIAEYLLMHEVMDGDQFEAAMDRNATAAELEAMAEEKQERSRKENAEKAKELPDKTGDGESETAGTDGENGEVESENADTDGGSEEAAPSEDAPDSDTEKTETTGEQ